MVTAVCGIANVTRLAVGRSLGSGGTGTAAAAATATGTGLNQPARDGQFEFSVHSVSCGHRSLQNGWLHADAKGGFCVVAMSVTNVGTDARRFADGVQQAIGSEGNRYEADTGAGVVANGNGDAVWNVVNPGITLSAKVVYDIPITATIVQLILHDSAFSRGVVVHVA